MLADVTFDQLPFLSSLVNVSQVDIILPILFHHPTHFDGVPIPISALVLLVRSSPIIVDHNHLFMPALYRIRFLHKLLMTHHLCPSVCLSRFLTRIVHRLLFKKVFGILIIHILFIIFLVVITFLHNITPLFGVCLLFPSLKPQVKHYPIQVGARR